MINLKASNNKLFFRAAEIVAVCNKLGSGPIGETLGQTPLLKAIYDTDEPTSDHRNAPVSAHIAAAGEGPLMVVPRAILIARGHTAAEARAAVEAGGSVRAILQDGAA